MGIYISNLKIPKDGYLPINIYPDGRVACRFDANCANAIELPPHGDLIDRDALRSSIKESIDECHKWADGVDKDTMMYARISQSIGTFVECSLRAKVAPAVIPASDKDINVLGKEESEDG